MQLAEMLAARSQRPVRLVQGLLELPRSDVGVGLLLQAARFVERNDSLRPPAAAIPAC
jgi:hypothetical protein